MKKSVIVVGCLETEDPQRPSRPQTLTESLNVISKVVLLLRNLFSRRVQVYKSIQVYKIRGVFVFKFWGLNGLWMSSFSRHPLLQFAISNACSCDKPSKLMTFIQITWLIDLKLLVMPGTNGYVVKQVSKQTYDLRKSTNQGETSKQKRWLWFRGSLWISLWRWQFFFWLAASEVNKRGIWHARRWDLKGLLAQTKPLSLLILVFMYITLCLSWWKKPDMVHVSSCQNILKYRVVIDYVTVEVKYYKISLLGILNGDHVSL